MTARSLLRSVSFAGDTACGLPQACTSARTVCRTTRLRFLMTAAACAERTARTVCTMPSAIGNPMSAGQGTSRFRPSRHLSENWASLPASSFGFRRLPPEPEGARRPRRCSFRRAGCRAKTKLLHWRTLLCARAIENGLTVLGADQYAPGKFVGHSMAFQPDGTALGELGEEQDLLIVKIN